jgi:hypothetical protein
MLQKVVGADPLTSVGAESMPQLDFRRLFPPAQNDEPGALPNPSPQQEGNCIGDAFENAEQTEWRGRLGYPGWVNVAFVALAVLGAIFCAFYFFNGTELLRTTTARSREFLYPPPPAAESPGG